MTSLTINRAVYPCKWIQMEERNTCPLLPAFIGHTQGYMLLDTGSSITLLDEFFFSKHFPDILFIPGHVNIESIHGSNDLRMVEKLNIRIGHIGGELPMPGICSVNSFLTNESVPVVGILGMDFIHRYCSRLDLDIKRELVTLYVAK